MRKTAVQQWVSEMTTGDGDEKKPKSATTVIRAYGVLASILDDAVDDRRILSNPARGVNLPRKGKKAHIYLSHEQVHLLAAESKYPTLILTLTYCGIRWAEAVGLRVKHLDMLKRRIRIEENAVEVGGRIEVGTRRTTRREAFPFPSSSLNGSQSSAKARGGMTWFSQGQTADTFGRRGSMRTITLGSLLR